MLMMPSMHVPDETRSYYDDWYATYTPEPYTDNMLWQRYVRRLQALVATLPRDARALEVGCGGGMLQHMMPQYIGVDIAASAARFIQQPFAAASATQLPFSAQTFDVVWSIWTLEHVIDPAGMLAEMQRVVRSGGYVFLGAAWCVPDWFTRGYHLWAHAPRTLAGRILWASVYPRKWLRWLSIWLTRLYEVGMRDARKLNYRFLLPNYVTYYQADADACVSIDVASVIIWYRARGVRCVSHRSVPSILAASHDEPLIFQVP
jgi:SAM-dependent methyltransferase